MHHGMAVVENVVYVHEGFDGLQHLNDLYALDLRENRWRRPQVKRVALCPLSTI